MNAMRTPSGAKTGDPALSKSSPNLRSPHATNHLIMAGSIASASSRISSQAYAILLPSGLKAGPS